MFLNETKILNYKTFRHKIQVQNFSPGFNILIGLNGSGKTTFLEAVSLLFFDFKKNPKDKPHTVSNFLSGPFQKAFSIVEISIENSDRIIPLPKNSIIIRRVLGVNLDRFLIFNQSLSSQQFFSLLDSLGFCREKFIFEMKQGEQTKFKELKSLARLNSIQNLIGEKVFSRFKEKIIVLLKNILTYKRKISEEVIKLKERISTLSFDEPTPEKKKLIKGTFFIFETKCRKNFKKFIQPRLIKLKIKNFKKNAFNLIFRIRRFLKKKRPFYIRFDHIKGFCRFFEKSLLNFNELFCTRSDCFRMQKLEMNFKFSKIQKLEKIWGREISRLTELKISIRFPPKKKFRKFFLVNSNKRLNIQNYVSKSLRPRFFLFRNNWGVFFNDFFQRLIQKNFLFKSKAFKIRQQFASFLYTLSKEKEKSEKILENHERKLNQIIGNKTFHGIQVILKILKLSPLMKKKVLGLFFDLFSVHRFFFLPIENFLGKILTYIVVENRETAFWIIRSLQKSYFAKGNFLLVEKEKVFKTPEIFSFDFFPIIFAIFFRPRLAFLLKSFFHSVFLSRDPFKNFRASKKLKIQLLTLDGEIFYSNGIISYGNKKKKNSLFQITSKVKKERSLFDWFIEKDAIVKNYLLSLEKKAGKLFLFFFISNKLSEFFLNRVNILKESKNDGNRNKKKIFQRYFQEESFTSKMTTSKKKKFLTYKKIFFFSHDVFYPVKINSFFLKLLLIHLSQIAFFNRNIFFGDLFIKNLKIFLPKKNSKKYQKKTQIYPLSYYPEKSKVVKIRKLLVKTEKIETKIISFKVFLAKKFSLKCIYNFFGRAFKIQKKSIGINIEILHLHGFFSKKEKLSCLNLLESLLKKKIKIQINKNRETHPFIRNQLFDLTNYSKEIDSDLFITGQIFEVLLKKKHKKMKKTLLNVSKNFNQIFKTVLPEGKSCIIFENKKFSPNLTKKKRIKIKNSGCDILAKFEKKGPFFFLEQMSNGQASLVSIILLLSIGKALHILMYIFDEADANLDSRNCFLLAFLFKKFSTLGVQFLISTFRKETTCYGDKWFGIAFSKCLTKVKTISKTTALKFTIKKNDY